LKTEEDCLHVAWEIHIHEGNSHHQLWDLQKPHRALQRSGSNPSYYNWDLTERKKKELSLLQSRWKPPRLSSSSSGSQRLSTSAIVGSLT